MTTLPTTTTTYHFHHPHHFLILLISFCYLTITFTQAMMIASKNFAAFPVGNGVYYAAYSSSGCTRLTLGYITASAYSDLYKLPYEIPSSFKSIISTGSTSYTSSYYSFPSTESYYFVLFNNATFTCTTDFYSAFRMHTLYSNGGPVKYTIPYGTTQSFTSVASTSSYDNKLVITADRSATVSLYFHTSVEKTTPSTTPSLSSFDSVTLSYGGSTKTSLPPVYSSGYFYGHLHCRSVSGCPVYLSVESSSGSSSSGVMIGAIVGPVTLFVLIVIIVTILSTIAAAKRRRRRMLAMAAVKTSTSTTTTTHQPFVPVPLATATTTTTENTTTTTMYVPPPVVAVAQQQQQQPYNPNQQPYNPYPTQPTNQPYYSNIPGEYPPSQPSLYNLSYTGNSAYYSHPNSLVQYISYQPTPYNTGVGVHPPPSSETVPNQHDPTPAYNPNMV